MTPEFTCQTCGATFQIPEATLIRFPGWLPKECMPCKKAREKAQDAKALAKARVRRMPPTDEKGQLVKPAPGKKAKGRGGERAAEAGDATAEELANGCYTDGSASPNPGPGGWAAVWVRDDQVVEERHGREPKTTNNRMELTGLIEAYRLLPAGESVTVWTDSDLCVKSMLQWAPSWEKNGWKRKTGPIQNLDLVQALYALVKARPELQLRWLRGHVGTRWNEYADELANKK